MAILKPDQYLIEAVRGRKMLSWMEHGYDMVGFAHAYGPQKGGGEAIVLVWLVDQGPNSGSPDDASPTPRWFPLNLATSHPVVLRDPSADQQRVLPYGELARFAELWQVA